MMMGGDVYDRHYGSKNSYDAAAAKDEQAQEDTDDLYDNNYSSRCSGWNYDNDSLCAWEGASEIRIQMSARANTAMSDGRRTTRE